MTVALQSVTQVGAVVLDRLANISGARGAIDLRQRLAALGRWVRADLADFEVELATLPRGARVVQHAAHHLLDLRGKHLRPLCVALASRFGEGFTPRARGLAVAVELVHTATLLHDDVVDVAERRRGQPAAAVVYGNAASIFAGDWLLVAALRRIGATGVEGLLDKMLEVIDEMIMAESLQLERRGRVVADRAEYFRIVEGKTAALFRWAMLAGGRCAGMTAEHEAVLEKYGVHLGVAFQAVDDELDFASPKLQGPGFTPGSGTGETGKDPLADLREGKMTYPLIVALEREPSLRARFEAVIGDEVPNRVELNALANAVRATGALEATRELAEQHVQLALETLSALPAGTARESLETVALASLERTS
jgi:octaprenyl-diphosphate synthase